MSIIEGVANISFHRRTDEEDYIFFENSKYNKSAVGRQGGRQVIEIFSWGWPMIICHEIMHALGFWNEQSRSD